MSRRFKIAIWSVAVVAAIAAGAYGYVVWAMQSVDPFYAEAMRMGPKQLQSASARMENRVCALCSDAVQPGRWQSAFTAEEVNGWLAVQLKEKYSHILPPEVIEPRVAFAAGSGKIGYRYEGESMNTVVSIDAEAYMAKDDLAAVRFRQLRAGMLPLPLSMIVEEVNEAAEKLEIPVRWTTADGDPVLLVPVSGALSTEKEARRLESIELRNGEIILAGRTEPLEKPSGNDASGSDVPAKTAVQEQQTDAAHVSDSRANQSLAKSNFERRPAP